MANKDKELYDKELAGATEQELAKFEEFKKEKIAHDNRRETLVGPDVEALESGIQPRDAALAPRESDAGDMIAGSMSAVGDLGGVTTSALSGAYAASEQLINDEKSIKDFSEDFNTAKEAYSTNVAEAQGDAPITSFVADLAMTGSLAGKAFTGISKAHDLSKAGKAGLAAAQGGTEGFLRSKKPLSKEGMVNTLFGASFGGSIEGLTSLRSSRITEKFKEMTEETKAFAMGVNTVGDKAAWRLHINNRDYKNVEGFIDTWINKKGKKGKPLFKEGDSPSDMVHSIDDYYNTTYKSVRKSVDNMGMKIKGTQAKESVQNLIDSLPSVTDGDKFIKQKYQDTLNKLTDVMEQTRLNDGSTNYVPTGIEKELDFSEVMDLADSIKNKAPSDKMNKKFNNFIEHTIEQFDGTPEMARKLGNVIKKSKELTDLGHLKPFITKQMDKSGGHLIAEMNSAIGYKSLVLMGIGQGLVGNKAGALVGATIARALQSKKLPLHTAKTLQGILDTSVDDTAHPMFREFVMTLINKDDSKGDTQKSNDALAVLSAKSSFRNLPFNFTIESAKIRKEPLIAMIRDSFGDQGDMLADRARDVIENGEDDEIGAFLERFQDNLQSFNRKEYTQETIGIDGKVYAPDKKAMYAKNLDNVDAPLQWKLMSKKALNLHSDGAGIIPTTPEEYNQKIELQKQLEKKKSMFERSKGPAY